MTEPATDRPMTAAEFRVTREHLGLAGDWLAAHFDVDPRTVRSWEQGRYPVPVGIAAGMRQLAAETAEYVDRAADALVGAETPRLLTYRNDDEYHEHEPGTVWPASWHRAVTARIAEEVPDTRIDYLHRG